MKEKKKSINSKLKKLSIIKLFAAIVLLTGIVFSLTRSNTVSSYLKSMFEAGQTPAHSKTKLEKPDGTTQLELTVTGDADTNVETAANVNVLVVFDTSSSMRDNDAAGSTGSNKPKRADAAEKVVYDFASALYGYQNQSNPSNIEMALVTFDSYSTTKVQQNWTSTANNILGKLSATGKLNSRKLDYHSGTNWEAGLRTGINDVLSRADNDPTFVLFVTDGAPYRRMNANGNGQESVGMLEGYQAARDEARTAATYKTGEDPKGNVTFYGIYAYGSEGDYLDDLVYYALNGSERSTVNQQTQNTDNYYNASNTAALTSAIEEIFQTIVNALGISSAKITDGTTSYVQTTSGKISHLLEVDEQSYKYWIEIPLLNNKFTRIDLVSGDPVEYTVTDNNNGTFTISWGNGKSVNVTGTKNVDGSLKYQWTSKNDLYNFAPPAGHYNSSTGAVEWDLSGVGPLLDGVTYSITFDVYPSQYTMDKVSEIKNGETVEKREELYNALDENERIYLEPVDGSEYRAFTLKTNTTATLDYVDTRTGQQGSTTYNNPGPIATETETISIEKIWEKALDGADSKVKSIDIGILRDDSVFYETTLSNNNWSRSGINIAPGLMKVEGSTVRILNVGHDYKFAELDKEAYRWELETQTVHPMKINGQMYELVLIDEVTKNDYTVPTDMLNDKTMMYKNDGTNTFYRLEQNSDKIYVQGNANPTVTATNHRRSNLNISKIVDGNSANPEDTFDITITVNDPGLTKNEKIWFSGWDGATVDFGNLEKQGWHKEEGEEWSGFYYANNNTSVTLSLKQGQNIRFTNLTDKATYTITEATKSGYKFANTNDNFDNYITGEEGVDKTPFKPVATIDSSSRTISGSITKTNSTYTVNVLNIYEKVDIEVTKNWDDQSNQDGLRNNVTVELIKNNDPTGETITIGTDSNTVTGKFTGKDRYDENGEEITYSVKENTTISGYTMGTPSCTNNKGKFVCEVTNSHTPEPTSVSGTKTWNDDDNRDNLRPDYIMVQLNKTVTNKETNEKVTTPVGDPVRVDKSTSWKYSWNNLPKYEAGEKIVYTVTENLGDDSKYTASKGEGEYDIVNNYSAQTTSVKVSKAWEDDNDRDGKRPDEVTVTITPGDFKVLPGAVTPLSTVTLNEENNWTYTWTDLFVNNTSQQHNTYSVTEAPVPGYPNPVIEKVNGNEYVYKITNIHEIDTTEINGTKTWNDNSDQDGVRPESITLKVKADGEYVKVKDETTGEEKILEVTISANDAVQGNADVWAYTFGNLPTYRDGGVRIEYRVEETLNFAEGTDPIPSYSRTDDKQGLDIVNEYTPEVIQISGTKIWKDDNNRDGVRPTSVKIQLYADGEEVAGKSTTTNADKQWGYSFDNLPRYKDGGTEIAYSVQEEDVDSNYTVVENDETAGAYDITNKHDPELYNNETGDITVEKVWDDNDDQDGIRNRNQITSVKVKLIATITNDDGEKVNVPYSKLTKDGIPNEGEYTLTENENGKYTKTISGLYKNYNGKEIYYTFEEVDDFTSLGYEKPVIDDKTAGQVTITNKHTPEEYGDIKITKVWDDDSNRDGLRKNVEVKLKASVPSGKTVTLPTGVKDTYTLSTTDTDTVTVSGLDKYFEGELITYEIEEPSVPTGYKISGYVQGPKDFKVTNKHTPEKYNNEKGEISIAKVWDDDGNRDGLRGDVKVTLKASTKSHETVPYDKLSETGIEGTYTLNEGNNYTVTETGLYKYYEGEEITYTIEETSKPTGYEITGYVQGPKDFKVTNKHTPELYNDDSGEITVKKVWDDNNDQDGIRKNNNITTVDVKLIATTSNGTVPYDKIATPETTIPRDGIYTLTESDNYSLTLEGLYNKYDGKLITYTFEEVGDFTEYDYEAPKVSATTTLVTITNKYSPEVTSVSGKKTWSDDDNRDNLRPTSVFVQLNQTINGVTTKYGEPVEVNESTNWEYSWSNLPKYAEQGSKITYTVTEIVETESVYTPEVDENNNITNNYSAALTQVKVTKHWDDDDNRDNARTNSVTVTLTPDTEFKLIPGTTPQPTVELNEGNEWTYTWTNLFVNNTLHQRNNYSVSEAQVSGYKEPAITKVSENEFDYLVTNTREPDLYNGTGEITVTKVWDDNNDQDGIRKNNNITTVDVKLIATTSNGAVPYDKIATPETAIPEDGVYQLKESEQYTLTVDGLYKNYQGNEITYTFEEVSNFTNIGYERPTKVETKDLVTITNKHTPEKYNNEEGEISIAKVWDDDGNRDRLRGDVKVTLKASTKSHETVPYDKLSETGIEGTYTLNEGNNYTVTETGLYKYYEGEEITYEIEETSKPTGYEITGYVQGPKEFKVTNKHDIEVANVTVTKSWIDDSNIENTRPESVTLHLLADGEEVDSVTLTKDDATDDNTWTHTFKNLPVNSSEGKKITYTVREDKVENYTVDYPEGKLTAVNTVENLKREITINKTWDDNKDQDGYRDDEPAIATLIGNITVEGKTEEVVRKEITIGLTDTWTTTVEVPIFAKGYKITYSLSENKLSKYTTSIADTETDGELTYDITNTHIPETVSKTVTKEWDDEGNQDGMRPENITVTLLANEEPTEFTDVLSESNQWTVTFPEVPKYANGEVIDYTVAETCDSEKYERTDDLKSLDIVNTHTPEVINYTISKIWNDDYDRDGKRPESITVQLLANGEAYGEPTVITIEEAEDFNKWTHTFTNLPKYMNGQPVEYTISEESVAYYTPGEVNPVNNTHEGDKYTDADTYEFDGELENTHEPELINNDDDDPDNDGQITVTKAWDDENNKYSSRPESITVLLYADGVEIGSVELSDKNNWTYTFTEDYEGTPLYKYRDQGIDIVYSIGEIKVSNYETIINGFDITNKYNGPVPEITPPNTGVVHSNNDNSLIELFILFITLTSTVIFRKKLMD